MKTPAKKKKERKPAINTPYKDSAVAQLRLATRLSKPDFAKHCCICENTITTIESRGHYFGQGVMESNALLIAAATGASHGNLMRNQLRPIGANRKYRPSDFKQHLASLELDDEDWKKRLLGVVSDRFDSLANQLAERSGAGFLVALFLLANEIDEFANKSLGAISNTRRDILREIKEHLSPDFTDRTAPELWQRLAAEESAERMAAHANAKKKERGLHPKNKRLASRRKA